MLKHSFSSHLFLPLVDVTMGTQNTKTLFNIQYDQNISPPVPCGNNQLAAWNNILT